MAIQNPGNSTKQFNNPFTSNRGYQGLFLLLKNELKDPSIPYLWDGSCGLDKGRITIPVNNSQIELQHGINALLGRREMRGQSSFVDFPNLFFSSCATPARAVQVEFNFADFTKSFGLNLCPFWLAPNVVKLVVHHTVENSGWVLNPVFFPQNNPYLEPSDYPSIWSNDVQYSRLELARDFIITDPKFKLEQMRFIRPKRAKAIAPMINDYSINTLSHPAGSSSARMTIYNKSLQAQKTDPGSFQLGTFRFEAKLPREQVKRHFIRNVHFGTVDRMHYSLKEFWERSNYWRPLLHEGNVHLELLQEHGNMDGALLIGYADSCAKGLGDLFSKAQHQRYGQILKGHNIKRFVPLERQGTPYAALDFTKGSLSY